MLGDFRLVTAEESGGFFGEVAGIPVSVTGVKNEFEFGQLGVVFGKVEGDVGASRASIEGDGKKGVFDVLKGGGG